MASNNIFGVCAPSLKLIQSFLKLDTTFRGYLPSTNVFSYHLESMKFMRRSARGKETDLLEATKTGDSTLVLAGLV